MLDVQADPDFLATVQNILECYRLRFPATHIHQSSRFDLQKTNSPKIKHEYESSYQRQGSPRLLGNLLDSGGRFCMPCRSARRARLEICPQPCWKRDHACDQQVSSVFFFVTSHLRELVMELRSAPMSTIFAVSRPMPESEHWRFQNKFLPLSLPHGYNPENQCKKLISPALIVRVLATKLVSQKPVAFSPSCKEPMPPLVMKSWNFEMWYFRPTPLSLVT